MKQALALTLALFAAPTAFADNYATCLLDKLEGVQNDQAARAAISLCRSTFYGLETVEQGSGRGWLGYDSGDECTLDKASSTQSRTAGYQIRLACHRLYDRTLDLYDEFGITPSQD